MPAANRNDRNSTVQIVSTVLTAFYVLLTLGLFLKAKEANELNRSSQQQTQDVIRNSERPWVGIDKMALADVASGKRMGVRMDVLNTGKTPALNLSVQSFVGLATTIPDGPPNRPPVPSYVGTSVLFPGQVTDNHPLFDEALTEKEYRDFLSGSLTFVVSGTVKYSDRFGQSHETKFCGYVNSRVTGQQTILHCAKGNSAT